MELPPEATIHFKRQCLHKRINVLVSLLEENDRILDVGCGIGTYITNPLSYLPVNIIGIDNDKNTIEYAKLHNKRNNVEFVVASAEEYAGEQFDVIVCSNIIEHLKEPEKILKNISHLLKYNGILYICIPNGFGAFEIQNFLPRMLSKISLFKNMIDRMIGIKDTLNMDSPHLHFYTVNKIKKLLSDTGWRIRYFLNDEIIGGIIPDRILPLFPDLYEKNTFLSDRVPHKFANGWIIVCEKSGGDL